MKTKVLVIDDEQIMRLTLGEGLFDLGYDVMAASDGLEGMEKLKSFRPDVILLDMRLKFEDGIDIARKIKEIDEYVEIIIMTAYGDIKTAIDAIKIGDRKSVV